MSAPIPRQLVTLGLLSQLELDIRSAEDARAVHFMAVNDIHRIVPYDHAVLWLPGPGIATVSGGIVVDPTQPQIRFFDRLAREQAAAKPAVRAAARIAAASLPAALQQDAARWLKADCIWVPLTAPKGRLDGGLFILRAEPFTDADMRVLTRLGSALGSALAAQSAAQRLDVKGWWSKRRAGLAMTAAALAVTLVPVQLSVLADARVVPLEPRIVAAPIDGVIRIVHVRPNQDVAGGQVLWSFDSTELSAARDIAEKRVQVLSAEQARAEQSGFREPKARSEITLLRSRLAEGETELAYARDRLARTQVPAPDPGVVMFDDPVSWVGRPVKVGERVMSVADPSRVRLEIALAVEDALAVGAGAQVEFYQAVAPDEPVPATLERVSYDAKLLPTQTVAFVAEAAFPAGIERPRLGSTGTAKVYGARVTLFYALLRKPLAALRRLVGY